MTGVSITGRSQSRRYSAGMSQTASIATMYNKQVFPDLKGASVYPCPFYLTPPPVRATQIFTVRSEV